MIRYLAVALLMVSFLGFTDAAYLALKYYQGEAPNCSILVGCEVVTTSRYATLWRIPVALLGALYYLTVFLLTVGYLDNKKPAVLRLAACLTALGFLASLWFLYLQAIVIGAYCLYCLVSAATSTILFILGILILRKLKPSRAKNAEPMLPA